ncbi:hypothetical protein ACFPIJ_09710 [Dactylosporangium cerinum]|uniref:AraC family transcriptional regulator n=1 Tax=Dactylosporangium cerinum TaxID=1434730 RepID=A0ABV9VNZ2_9ACTN
MTGPDTPPPAVTDWLARLEHLHGVPFANLVADARLLPAESVRFFHLDVNWLEALLDGALSVAASTDAHARTVAELVTTAPVPPSTPDGPSGLLLRSALVTGWPGLTVTGYDGAGTALPPLRTARPAPSVLFVLFPRLVHRVELEQPAEGLSFGTGPTPVHVVPRYLGGAGHPAGLPVRGSPRVPVPLRDPDRRVLDVTALADRLADALADAYRPDAAPPLTPAGLGLQLITPAARRVFTAPDAGRGGPR